MKKTIITFSTFLFIIGSINSITAQINRTLETKVADILAQLPTKNLEHSDQLMEEIIGLNEEGILQFCDMLVPLGTGDDTQARYAIESLAIYSGGREGVIKNGLVENALLQAIEKVNDTEVKTFLIRRLIRCGTNSSISSLRGYLTNDKLFRPTLASLIEIGTPEASKVIYDAAQQVKEENLPAFIVALGDLKYEESLGYLERNAASKSLVLKEKSLMALAEIANSNSNKILLEAVKESGFNLDKTKSIIAYIHYGNSLKEDGNTKLSEEVANNLLKNCKSDAQLHFRSAGIYLLRDIKGTDFTKTLIKEAKNSNNNYRTAVFGAAAQGLNASEVDQWIKAYKKMSDEAKPQLIRMLSHRKETAVFEECLVPAIKDENKQVRIAGIKALVGQNKAQALPVLFEALKKADNKSEYKAVKDTLLRLCNAEDNATLAGELTNVTAQGQEVLIEVLAARKAIAQFDTIFGLLDNKNKEVNSTIYASLSSISSSSNISDLLSLIEEIQNDKDLINVQNAIIHVLDNAESDVSNDVLSAFKSTGKKENLLAVLPAVSDEEALALVVESLNSDNQEVKEQALEALANWRNNKALPHLFEEGSSSSNFRSKAFGYYLSQVSKSNYPDDQKLLLIEKLMPYSKSVGEQKQVLNRARNIKTFLSLIFVSKYLKDKELISTASNAAIRIALPSPGVDNGLSGDIVRDIVSKSIDNLSGQDSQYIKIDVKEFLDNMSDEKGFVSIFNGKDLTGWEGLVKNPIARAKMSKNELAKAQKKANEQMLADWFVKDGVIGFKGEGYNNICTIKDYGDFEMIVDWKITNGGDSGIYLRGTPQVQIWDVARVDVGAQVGSGGLYNNQTNERIPLEVVDNPINDWNTFRIKMVGERVTVYLNGVLVTDNVVLENYWDRKLPIFSKEAIELQAHGEDLGFRNIYVREIGSGEEFLSEEEKKEGFQSLFNGEDLDHWTGNKTDYIIENKELAVRPKNGGHGNLYTAKEYSDFIFRFEFKLTPGANNGLGIHAPLEGDAAYVGKELQILDNTAKIYSKLKEYQYHGSVYGIIPSKRGFLNPVGEWNTQEVIVEGDDIKITLNGTIILEGNFTESSKNGTLDGKNHPGLKRNKGHIGFLGHGSELEFRNIRIKDLSK